MDWAAKRMALSPEAHTLLIAVQGVFGEIPAPSAACRAGAWPVPACSTWPTYTSSTNSGERAILSNAARMAVLPKEVAVQVLNAPRKLPMGVRWADTITTECIGKVWSL